MGCPRAAAPQTLEHSLRGEGTELSSASGYLSSLQPHSGHSSPGIGWRMINIYADYCPKQWKLLTEVGEAIKLPAYETLNSPKTTLPWLQKKPKKRNVPSLYLPFTCMWLIDGATALSSYTLALLTKKRRCFPMGCLGNEWTVLVNQGTGTVALDYRCAT